MRDIDIAYIAGLLDADGHISVRRANAGKSYQGVAVMTGITNTHRGVLDEVSSYFQGTVHTRKAPSINKNWTQTYNWTCIGSRAAEFLKAVRPYLRIKGDRADLAIEVAELTKNRKLFRIGPEERARREEIFFLMKDLNRTNKH